ncbi:MAG: hypothetical protein HY774_21450 [Acidobacteria bacterium]|nr:hypothetical protein [Acidobacteriota bacterium]
MQLKLPKKKLISLGIYFVLADLITLGFVVYLICYPNDCLKKIASTPGLVISSNEYQQAAHKIADAIRTRQLPGGRMLLVGVVVDQNGKVCAVDVDRHEVLIDEDPQTEPKTELWGSVNLTSLPGNSVFGMLVLAEGKDEMVGQSAMLYQRK